MTYFFAKVTACRGIYTDLFWTLLNAAHFRTEGKCANNFSVFTILNSPLFNNRCLAETLHSTLVILDCEGPCGAARRHDNAALARNNKLTV